MGPGDGGRVGRQADGTEATCTEVSDCAGHMPRAGDHDCGRDATISEKVCGKTGVLGGAIRAQFQHNCAGGDPEQHQLVAHSHRFDVAGPGAAAAADQKRRKLVMIGLRRALQSAA